MSLTMFEQVEKVATPELLIEPDSLYRAFEQVTDGRHKKGQRSPLPLLLTLLMLGKLAGETTINGIVDWIKERQGWLREQFDWPKRFPTNSTYSEALARCDAEQVVKAIAGVLLKAQGVEQCGSEPSRLHAQQAEAELKQVAMDGKTLCGTLGHESQAQPKVASAVFLGVPERDRLGAASGQKPAKMRPVLVLTFFFGVQVKGSRDMGHLRPLLVLGPF